MEAVQLLILLALCPIPAFIAQKKGRRFGTWLALSIVLWIVALPAALLLKKPTRACPKCTERINQQASLCRYCRSEVAPLTAEELERLQKELARDSWMAFAKGGALVLASILAVGLVIWQQQKSLTGNNQDVAQPPSHNSADTPSTAAPSPSTTAELPTSQEATPSVEVQANIGPYDITSYCKNVSDTAGGSYQIEKACRDGEEAAQQRVAGMNISTRIAKYCSDVGHAAGGSFEIAEACILEETKAKASM